MLVTLEGPDGAGKSTVKEALMEEYPEAMFTKEPDDDTEYGQHVRDVIADDEAPKMAVFFAFLEDHAVHVETKVRPALDEGRLVVSDRYIDSRYAYQTSSLDPILDVDALPWIRSIQEAGWTVFPDVTLLLDVTPEEGAKRMAGRGEEADRFENLDKQRQVRQTYLNLAEEFDDRYVVVNTMQQDGESVEECKQRVIDECIKAIEKSRVGAAV